MVCCAVHDVDLGVQMSKRHCESLVWVACSQHCPRGGGGGTLTAQAGSKQTFCSAMSRIWSQVVASFSSILKGAAAGLEARGVRLDL